MQEVEVLELRSPEYNDEIEKWHAGSGTERLTTKVRVQQGVDEGNI